MRNPSEQERGETIPAHLCALTAADEDAPPQPSKATLEDAQLSRVTRDSVVLVISQHNLPKPHTDLARTMMLPALKLDFHGLELRDHPLLRCNPPDDESSVGELPTEVGETQESEGLWFSLSTPFPVSSGKAPLIRVPEGLQPSRTTRCSAHNTPPADSCRSVRTDHSILSFDFETNGRSPEVSSYAFSAQPPDLQPVPWMDTDFAVTCPLVQHRMPQIRFLYIGSRLCSTLRSDPASRRRPCASLSLHVHHVVKRTCTS